jgi:hypothetical protein
MKIKLIFTFLVTIFITTISFAQEKYGKEITLEKKTEISDIISNSTDYVGKKVLIEGEVLAVCKMAGCWMEVAGEDGDKMKVKVKDGEIVFPQEAIGENALVEGEVYTLELDEEHAKDYLEHMAEDAGEEFDPSSVKGPMTIYQIKGIGVVIQ